MRRKVLVVGLIDYLKHPRIYTSEEQGGVYPVFMKDGWVIIRDRKGDHAWWRTEHVVYMGYVD